MSESAISEEPVTKVRCIYYINPHSYTSDREGQIIPCFNLPEDPLSYDDADTSLSGLGGKLNSPQDAAANNLFAVTLGVRFFFPL